MSALLHEPSGMSKAAWSDADFEVMGWHDCRVHALLLAEYEDGTLPPMRLLLDIDYILAWVEPKGVGGFFSFWVAPATLAFEHVQDLEGDIGPTDLILEIADINRYAADDGQSGDRWEIEGQNFGLKFRASAYRQYIRREPVLMSRQVLSLSERGGVSFAEQPYA